MAWNVGSPEWKAHRAALEAGFRQRRLAEDAEGYRAKRAAYQKAYRERTKAMNPDEWLRLKREGKR